MSTLPLSATDSNMLTVSVSASSGTDGGVTTSSESGFSSVLDSSIQTDAPPAADTNVTEPSVSQADNSESQASKLPAETAVDMLTTLQAARQMDTSLKMNAVSESAPVNTATLIPTPDVQEDISDHVSLSEQTTDEKLDKSAKQKSTTETDPASIVIWQPEPQASVTTVNKDLATSKDPSQTPEVQSDDAQIKSGVATTKQPQSKNGNSVSVDNTSSAIIGSSQTESDNAVVPPVTAKPNTDDTANTGKTEENTPSSSGVATPDKSSKHSAKTTEGKHQASSDKSSLAEAPSIDVTASSAVAGAAAATDEEAPAKTDENSASDSNQPAVKHSANDNNPAIVPVAAAVVPDAALAAALNTNNEANPVSASTTDSASVTANSVTDTAVQTAEATTTAKSPVAGNKGKQTDKSASVGQMIHELVAQVKTGDGTADVTADAITPANTISDSSKQDDDSKSPVNADSVNVLPEKKADEQIQAQTSVNPDSSHSAETRIHDNHGVSLTGKSALTSTGSLPDQAQGLRGIHDQLPTLYVKNGQIEEHELAARVVLMAGEKWQEAELQLEPQNMGKVRIQLTINQEQQANVQFIVQHAQTKDALDQSLPRLRELLTQHGLQPGQTQVQQQASDNGSQSWRQQMADRGASGQQNGRGSTASSWGSTGSNESDVAQSVTVSASQAAGIDFYA